MKKTTIIIAAFIFSIFASCGGGGSNSVGDISLIPVKSGDAWGFVDKTGKIKINPQFRGMSLFKDGLALVCTNDDKRLWGFIDEAGKYVINPTFLSASEFENGIAVVVAENEAPKAINKKGETIFTLPNAEYLHEFNEGLAGFATIDSAGRQKWGFVDEKGKVKITPQFLEAKAFSNGKAAVRNDGGKWGYIDKEGKFSINPQFDNADNFSNGKAVVQSGRQKGVIDEKGQYIINPQFIGIRADGNMYLVNSGGKYGWTDKEGKFIINPQFDYAYPFAGNNLAPVKSGSSWGYIDTDGKFVINAQFSEALPFNGGLAIVESGNQIGMIDNKGKYLVNPQFAGISGSYRDALIGKDGITTVVSDFFDANSIVNRIKNDITPTTVAGFNFATPIAEMMSKYNKTASDFNYYGNDNYLIKDEKIGKYAKLSLSVGGTIYMSQGWSYVINPQANVNAFGYAINLEGKAVQKKEQLMKAFENAFSGYTKEEASLTFTSPQQKITIEDGGYRINIIVKPAVPVQ